MWLRILEYYSGILFITTNRIGVIDEAFKSRIHVCLRYPSLDLAGTRLIWEKLLSKIERQNHEEPVKIVFERDAVLGFAEKHYHMHAETKSTWNGRQIRNVIQTAISLGQHERLRKLRKRGMTEEEAERSGKQKYMQVELSKQNLSKIAATATDFEQYMVDVRGSDINLAKNESVRNDDFYKGKERQRKQYEPWAVDSGAQGMASPLSLSSCQSRRIGGSSHDASNQGRVESQLSYPCDQAAGGSNEGKFPSLDDSDSEF